ncbi:MAG: permease-like cell division protein FtsX [Succinivibrionaceae bacterium]|nr:permease-like cell division protein FtsX [Succinivibrionaceae bacterium]
MSDNRRATGREWFILNHWNVIKRSFLALLTSPFRTCLTLSVIAVSLAIPMTFYVLYLNALAVTSRLNDTCQISLYLRADLTSEQTASFVEKIRSEPDVRAVKFISKDEGLKEFSKISGFAEPIKYLADNPLPDVLVVMPAEEVVADHEISEAMLKRLIAYGEVEQGKFDLMWVKRLKGIGNLMRNLAVSLGVMLLAGVILTVANTVRINVMSRREEITIMRFFGATDSFIARPYIYSGIMLGFFGGLLAWWVNEFFVLCASYIVNELAELYGETYQMSLLSFGETSFVVIVSVLLSVIATKISLSRFNNI